MSDGCKDAYFCRNVPCDARCGVVRRPLSVFSATAALTAILALSVTAALGNGQPPEGAPPAEALPPLTTPANPPATTTNKAGAATGATPSENVTAPRASPDKPGVLSPERQREILRDALNAYDAAVEVAQNDLPGAHELFRQAAAGFEALCDAGVRNAALELALGNTHYRLSELGQAILHYRRAEQLRPRDPRIRANLEYVRERVEPRLPAAGGQRLLQSLLFWQYQTSLRERFWLAAGASSAGWLLLSLWLLWPRRPLLWTGLALAALGLANAGSVGWQLQDESRRPHAVVVSGQPTLRRGRGEAYEAVLPHALGPGVELRIIGERGGWYEVELPSGTTGWLPADVVTRV